MKNLIIFLFVMIIAGCGGENTPANNDPSVKTNKANDAPASNDGSTDVKTDQKKSTKTTSNQTGDKVADTDVDDNVNKTESDKNSKNDPQQSTTANTKQSGPTSQDPPPAEPERKTPDPKTEPAVPGNSSGLTTRTTMPGDLTGNDGMSVFVGTFARWTKNGDQFDGSYDASHALFLVCATNRFHPAARNEITFQDYGSCDSSLAGRIKLMKGDYDGHVNVKPIDIKVVGGKGIIKEGNYTRVIEFDRATIKKIEKAAAYKRPKIEMTPRPKDVDDPVIKQPGQKYVPVVTDPKEVRTSTRVTEKSDPPAETPAKPLDIMVEKKPLTQTPTEIKVLPPTPSVQDKPQDPIIKENKPVVTPAKTVTSPELTRQPTRHSTDTAKPGTNKMVQKPSNIRTVIRNR